jgi:uncharacterized membrane protein YidH (DUF202 family)
MVQIPGKEDGTMAPLQKRALVSLLIGIAFTIALIVVFLLEGDITAFDRDETLRYVTFAVLIGVPFTYLILIDLTLHRPTQLDERDRLIMLKSGRIQWLAVIFSLVAWVIALTEIYRETHQVPVVFLTLIFISILIIGILAQSLGILLGYWRMNRIG